jgi:hypothetical protein
MLKTACERYSNSPTFEKKLDASPRLALMVTHPRGIRDGIGTMDRIYLLGLVVPCILLRHGAPPSALLRTFKVSIKVG